MAEKITPTDPIWTELPSTEKITDTAVEDSSRLNIDDVFNVDEAERAAERARREIPAFASLPTIEKIDKE